MVLFILVILSSLLFVFVYRFFHHRFRYWSDRGVSGPPPVFVLGNLGQIVQIGQLKVETKWLRQYGSLYGLFHSGRPVLTVAKPDLIKQVLVKDFASFVNRDNNLFEHDIWSTNLFSSQDEQWRRIRAIVSPTFTTGKLRAMNSMMNRAVDQLVDCFRATIEQGQSEVNIKKVISGFTMDVIAATSFATKTNANAITKDGKSSAFLENGVNLVKVNPARFLSLLILPKKLNHWMRNSFAVNETVFNFFIDLAKEILNNRKLEYSKNSHRTDLVQLLMDAYVYESDLQNLNYGNLTAGAEASINSEEINNNNDTVKQANAVSNASSKKTLTENEIIAQIILFFIAGFETTATTISNCLYHLALQPDIQERLYHEIEQSLVGVESDSSDYCEKVNTAMPYLDAVIKETLRLCPPLARVQRQVGVANYRLTNDLTLEKDTIVEIAIYALHHNDQYFADAERFCPDRFLPEHRHRLVPYTYLPFGGGPRNCVGMRFAYQEMRLCLAKVVRQFRFEPTANTKIPLEYNKFGFIVTAKDISLKVIERNLGAVE